MGAAKIRCRVGHHPILSRGCDASDMAVPAVLLCSSASPPDIVPEQTHIFCPTNDTPPLRGGDDLSSRAWSTVADSLEDLGRLVSQRRTELKLSLREASEASGVPVATLSRIEQGRMPDLATFQRVVQWLGVPAARFFDATERVESTPEAIAEHLMADPALPQGAADKIAGIVRDLYQSLAATDKQVALHLRAAKTFTPPALRLLTGLLDEMQTALAREPQR